MPRLTRAVPVAGGVPSWVPGVLPALLTDTMNLTRSLAVFSMVGASCPAQQWSGRPPGRDPRQATCPGDGPPSAVRWGMSAPRRSAPAVTSESSISKNSGIGAPSGQPEHPGQPAAAGRAGSRPPRRCRTCAPGTPDGRRPQARPAARRPGPARPGRRGNPAGRTPPAARGSGRSRPARVGAPAARASWAAPASSRLVAGSSSPQAASSSATAAAPHQRGVERRAGGLQPGVQPVEPARPPGHVDRDQDRDGDGDDADGQPSSPAPPSPCRCRGGRRPPRTPARRPRATTGQS